MKKFEDLSIDEWNVLLYLINSHVTNWTQLSNTKGISAFHGINYTKSSFIVILFDYSKRVISIDGFSIDINDIIQGHEIKRQYISFTTSIKIAILKKIEEFGVDIDSYTFNF